MIQIIINDIANKVRATLLDGLDTATSAVITATDSVLSALGKLQAQYSGLSALIAQKTGTTAKITTGNVITTSNVASDITGLTATLEANKRYRFFGVIRTGCNNTGGLSLGIDAPVGSTLSFVAIGFSTGVTTIRYASSSTLGGTAGIFNAVNEAGGGVFVFGEIATINTGNAQLIFRSIVSTQTSTIFKTGTWINFTEL